MFNKVVQTEKTSKYAQWKICIHSHTKSKLKIIKQIFKEKVKYYKNKIRHIGMGNKQGIWILYGISLTFNFLDDNKQKQSCWETFIIENAKLNQSIYFKFNV